MLKEFSVTKKYIIFYLATTKENLNNNNNNTLYTDTLSYIRNENKKIKDDFFLDFNGIKNNIYDDVTKGKINF